MTTCALEGLNGHASRAADSRAPLTRAFLPPGALRLTNLGYSDLGALQDDDWQEGYFLSRLPPRVAVYDGQGRKQRLATFLTGQQDAEVDVWLEGGRQRAARRVRRQELAVACALGVGNRLRQALRRLVRQLQRGCRVVKRRSHPATVQKLLDPRFKTTSPLRNS